MQPVQQRIRTGPGSSFNLWLHRPLRPQRQQHLHYHRHGEDELLFLHQGRCHVELAGGSVILADPAVLWIGADQAHGVQPLTVAGVLAELHILQVAPPVFAQLGGDLPEAVALQRLRRRARHGLLWQEEAAASVLAQVSPLQRAAGLDRLQGLFRLLCGLVELPAAMLAASVAPDAEDARVQRFFTWLHEHLNHPVGLDAAAHELGLSRSQVARWLRRQTGQSLLGLLHRLRIERACRLLIEGQQPITAIAESVGFGTQAQFNRVFKRLTGQTPRSFRTAG